MKKAIITFKSKNLDDFITEVFDGYEVFNGCKVFDEYFDFKGLEYKIEYNDKTDSFRANETKKLKNIGKLIEYIFTTDQDAYNCGINNCKYACIYLSDVDIYKHRFEIEFSTAAETKDPMTIFNSEIDYNIEWLEIRKTEPKSIQPELIHVGFSLWTIPDGSYSVPTQGDEETYAIGLSFKTARKIQKEKKALNLIKEMLYYFAGEIIHIEWDSTKQIYLVIDTGKFKFFVSDANILKLKIGDYFEGIGYLGVDSYEWMHVGHDYYQNPNGRVETSGVPNIYYNFIIDKIIAEKRPPFSTIPARFDGDWDSFACDDCTMMRWYSPRIYESEEINSADDDNYMFEYLVLKLAKNPQRNFDTNKN